MIPKSLAEYCIEFDAALGYYEALIVVNSAYKRRVGHKSEWLTYLEQEAKRELNQLRRYDPMVRTMYDSTNPEDIPDDAEIVAYYPHAWGTDITAHSHALVVRIDNTGAHADDCHILDVEQGAASDATAHEWVMSWHKLHPDGMDAVNGFIRKPVLYADEAALPQLRTECAGLDYDIWGARWGEDLSPITGCFALQYVNHGPQGQHYDMSLVFNDQWGIKPSAPVTPPPPPPPVEKPPFIKGIVTWWDNEQYYTRPVEWHEPPGVWQ